MVAGARFELAVRFPIRLMRPATSATSQPRQNQFGSRSWNRTNSGRLIKTVLTRRASRLKMVDNGGIEPPTSRCKRDVFPLELIAHIKLGRANRIRTDVTTLKGSHPRPLDDNSAENNRPREILAIPALKQKFVRNNASWPHK